MSLISELKRRNVFRVATAYIIAGWIIMQVIDVMSPALQFPDWVASLMAVILMIGFPIAIVVSWIYEVTEDGLKKTTAIGDQPSITHQTGRRLDVAIIAGLLLVGGLIIWQQLSPAQSSGDAPTAIAEQDASGNARSTDAGQASAAIATEPEPEVINQRSVAVLPFVDLSAEGDQEYFADGISEEILNVLAGVRALKVAGRTSSFSSRARMTTCVRSVPFSASLTSSKARCANRATGFGSRRS